MKNKKTIIRSIIGVVILITLITLKSVNNVKANEPIPDFDNVLKEISFEKAEINNIGSVGSFTKVFSLKYDDAEYIILLGFNDRSIMIKHK